MNHHALSYAQSSVILSHTYMIKAPSSSVVATEDSADYLSGIIDRNNGLAGISS